MADKARRQLVLLAGLAAVLLVIVAWQFWPRQGARTTAGDPSRRPSADRGAAAGTEMAAVRLPDLTGARPTPAQTGRNPFRFQAIGTPDVTGGGAGNPGHPVIPEPSDPSGPPAGPPPPPPVPYKFIGTLTAAPPTGKVAVLSDGKFVFYGREGDIIEGRYRLVKIGEESLQIEYLDGRGRQTLRMSGS